MNDVFLSIEHVHGLCSGPRLMCVEMIHECLVG